MGWETLNVALSVSADTIPWPDGKVTATLVVSGRTNGDEVVNRYVASIRDDYVFPDILWRSEERTVGPDEEVEDSFRVDITCDKRRHVIGPHGSSHERTAELYGQVDGGDCENSTDEIPVRCVKQG